VFWPLSPSRTVSAIGRSPDGDHPMPDKLRDAIRFLSSLAGDRQQRVARVILDRAAWDDEWKLSDEQIADVQSRTVGPSRKLFSIAEARKRSRRLDA